MRYADNSIVSNPGSCIRPIYGPKVNADGSITVIATGKENFDEYINSFRESTDIAFILSKLAAGDSSVINKGNVQYGDFTNLPSTFAEVLQMQIDANRAFDRLPVAVKQKFNNDVNMWLASSGSDSWIENMKDVLDEKSISMIRPNDVKEEESNSNES